MVCKRAREDILWARPEIPLEISQLRAPYPVSPGRPQWLCPLHLCSGQNRKVSHSPCSTSFILAHSSCHTRQCLTNNWHLFLMFLRLLVDLVSTCFPVHRWGSSHRALTQQKGAGAPWRLFCKIPFTKALLLLLNHLPKARLQIPPHGTRFQHTNSAGCSILFTTQPFIQILLP